MAHRQELITRKSRELSASDGHLFGCLDANLGRSMLCLDNSDGDGVVDDDRFVVLAGNDEHPCLPLLGECSNEGEGLQVGW
jgi:hypothetical protein